MFSREIESSVQMRLYSMSKRHFVVVICLFFLSFTLTLLIGIAGPPIIISYSNNNSKVSQFNEMKKFYSNSVVSKSMSVFNQQLWLTATITTKDDEEKFPKVNVTVNIAGIIKGNNEILIYNGSNKFTQRKFKCVKTKCEEIFIAHINFSSMKIYKFYVGISHNNLDIKTIEFTFSTFSSYFSQLEIWFRFSFLVLGFIATVIYNNSLRKFSIRDWSMEQKWVAVLLPSLVIYNNPLVPLKFIVNSPVTSVLDTIFKATFICLLMLFWVTIYHGMQQTKRRCLTFYFPKICIVLLIWFMIVLLPAFQAIRDSADPTFYYKLQNTFLFYKFTLLGSIVIYILYALFLIITACGELRSVPYFNIRIRFFACFMFIVLVFSIVMIGLRYGSGLFNNNFVFERASRYANSVEFCAQYGMINLYLFIMAYAYSPAKNAIHEANFQDDPNLSMVNESDEDVLYGSDIEEANLLSRKSTKSKLNKR
uniref:GCR084 n=1 Tax=Schmidtea mediterranea TaxID=79327 RepID=A0A193KUL1_SCHMD|nr:GCR084 [Schmidtea mediterranea]